MKKSNAKKAGNWQRPALILLCVVLSLVLVVLILGAIYLNHWMGRINRVSSDDNYTLSQEEAQRLEQQQASEESTDPSAKVLDEKDIIWDADPSQIIGSGDDVVNILLIGQDRRPGEGRARSDSMILCTFNKTHGTLTMTSFLRDLYVQIPGYQDTRINAAYALGGMELLDQTLAVNFGVHVDANVEVDFTEFEQIIDLLGGVDIYLTSAEASYLNRNNGWALPDGMNHLTGAQALAYSRIRYLDSDFYRTNRQRNVLSSLIDAYKGLSLDRMLSLLDSLLQLVTTDMSNAEIAGYVTQLFPMLSSCTVNTQRIPIDDGYESASIRGMSVLVPDLEKNRQFLIDTLTKDALQSSTAAD